MSQKWDTIRKRGATLSQKWDTFRSSTATARRGSRTGWDGMRTRQDGNPVYFNARCGEINGDCSGQGNRAELQGARPGATGLLCGKESGPSHAPQQTSGRPAGEAAATARREDGPISAKGPPSWNYLREPDGEPALLKKGKRIKQRLLVAAPFQGIPLGPRNAQQRTEKFPTSKKLQFPTALKGCRYPPVWFPAGTDREQDGLADGPRKCRIALQNGPDFPAGQVAAPCTLCLSSKRRISFSDFSRAFHSREHLEEFGQQNYHFVDPHTGTRQI